MTSSLDARNDLRYNRYGYVPTEWICILFIVLFATSALLHAVQGIRSRLWWILWTVCAAGLLEILGWSGRLWSSLNPVLKTPYLMQIVTTIIGPTPLVAANFIILGQIIRRLGQNYSRLSAQWYTIIFCSCDFVSLIVQAVGGAKAAGATTESGSNLGGNIMLGGIAFQLVSITFYMIFAMEFLWRYLRDRPVRPYGAVATSYALDRDMELMILALAFSSGCIYIRSIYRLVELSDGWHGVVIRTQVYFNVFDAAMVTLAMFTLNILNPGRLLGPGPTWKEQPKTEKTLDDPFSPELQRLQAAHQPYCPESV